MLPLACKELNNVLLEIEHRYGSGQALLGGTLALRRPEQATLRQLLALRINLGYITEAEFSVPLRSLTLSSIHK